MGEGRAAGRPRRRRGVLAAALVAAASAPLLGAAEPGAADTTGPECGTKPICVTVTDQAGASLSTSEAPRYVAYQVRIANGGSSSTLVNITLQVTWQDSMVRKA